jgi:RNA polymerase sigma-70 factor, ECF subfamily
MRDWEQKFSRIFDENRHRIYRLCYAYLDNRNLVEDLFQEVWLNVWRSLPSFRGDAQVSTWMHRIAVNTALLFNEQTRRKRSEKPLDDAVLAVADARSNPERAASDGQKLRQLREALSALSGPDRLLVALYLEGASYRDMSEILGVSVNLVGVRLTRIRQSLSRKMEGF